MTDYWKGWICGTTFIVPAFFLGRITMNIWIQKELDKIRKSLENNKRAGE